MVSKQQRILISPHSRKPCSVKAAISYFDHCERHILCCYIFNLSLVHTLLILHPPTLASNTTCSRRSGRSAWVFSSAAQLWQCSATGPTTPAHSFPLVPPTPQLPSPPAASTPLLEMKRVLLTSAAASTATVARPSTSAAKGARTIANNPNFLRVSRTTLLQLELWATTSPGSTLASARTSRPGI
jgi:hypothetical protein